MIFGVAGTLIAEAVEHAKLQKLTDSQGKFFKDLAAAGVTKDDWGDKLEYARYATYMYGGRDTPDDKSMFEYQSDEWKHFKETEDKKRQLPGAAGALPAQRQRPRQQEPVGKIPGRRDQLQRATWQ